MLVSKGCMAKDIILDDIEDDDDELVEVEVSATYQNLAEEVDEQQQRISAFMRGRDKVTIHKDVKKKNKREVDESDILPEPVLPTVDSLSQMTLRRKIVYDKINSV